MPGVDDVIAELEQAWNAGDSAAWAANFADDAVFVDVLGRVQHGREMIAQEHQKIFDTIYRGSQIAIRALSTRVLDDDLILVHTRSTLRVPSGPRAGDTHAIQTKMLHGGLIQAFHNTVRSDLAGFANHDQDLATLSPLGWRQADS